MPPMGKVKLDKAAWAWCSEVEPENITQENIASAYRLNLPRCGFSKCRRNCQGNPFCLTGLGESKWLCEGGTEELRDEDIAEGRSPDSFVGLRNLGATCYINSLLQLWFHNIAFRNSILRWDPGEENGETSAVGYLQFLFALMQFGRGKSVDPSDFVSSLEIDVSLQQDAREFSQLFISYLEDSLRRQTNPLVRNLVNDTFQGRYNYITRCSQCNTESLRESTFYELEVKVQGHRTLDESIAEFLREEKLEGDDRYYCGVCLSKQDAARRIELSALPPVFNLQLIRFIYDRQKGMKKKLNTPLQFPETLDMSPYLRKGKDPGWSAKYNLFAVLIHKGTSANSGHYVAHICDQTSSNWYMFNDESTQKIEGKKLKLNSDEDYEVEEGCKKPKGAKAIKGYLCSSNAYMLVYTASDSNLDKTPMTEDSLQSHLKAKLEESNSTFDSIITRSLEEKRCQAEYENLMKAEMVSFLSSLPVGEASDWEAISRSWLGSWISSNRPSGFRPVDNHLFTCSHGSINPSLIKEFKFINKEVANNIYDKYGGGPRMDKNSLCSECVKLICHDIRTKTKIANDQKEISNLIRAKENIDPPSFWVGKESLRTWKAKALKSLERWTQLNVSSLDTVRNLVSGNDTESPLRETEEETKSNGHSEPKQHTNGVTGEEAADPPSTKSKITSDEERDREGSEDGKLNGNKTDEDDDDDYEFNFNQDIVCSHENLTAEESSRKLVPEQAWKILKSYFPECREFSSDTEPCIDCQCLVSEGKVAKDLHKQQALREKELLSNLYLGRNRPKPPFFSSYHVLSEHEFVKPWRKFIKEPTRRDPMTSLRNSTLSCPHNGLKYNPNNPVDLERLCLVTDEEWEKLSSNFKVDLEVILEFQSDGVVSSIPEVCLDCVAVRRDEEQQALLEYSNAKVYIRQMSKVEEEPSGTNAQGKDKGQLDGPIRRSSRNKRSKVEKVFRISSNQTLLSLKLEILNWLKVAPFDQHLYLEDGKELLDHQATLASLSVFPGSVINLQVDEPEDESQTDEGARKRNLPEPEHGFKGTGLLKR